MNDLSVSNDAMLNFPHDNAPKSDAIRQAMSFDLELAPTDISIDFDSATVIPMGQLASLGVAFSGVAELIEAFQPAASAGEQLYRVILPKGATGVLKTAKDGTAYGFAEMVGGGKSKLAKFVPVDGASASTIVPVDPATLMIAIALFTINERLDAIQETQQEMFTYIKNKDKAELRGNLETLADILKNYQFNWDNDQYKTNKHILVQSIRSDAEKAIIQHRAEINGRLSKKGPFHIDKDVRAKVSAIRSEFEEYRIAVYLFSFSTFLEVMLLENFDSDYLHSCMSRIDKYYLGYRKLYTDAYDFLESHANSSMECIVRDGASGMVGFLGKAIEKTPIGDRTKIDETLISTGEGIGNFNKKTKQGALSKFVDARSSDVRPFIENIQTVDRLFNQPVALSVEGDTLSVLPIVDAEED